MSKEKPGPTSEAGKRIASQNAAKHHMTGRVLLIDGENQSDLDALLAEWQEEYPTDTVEAAKLVQEAANSEWILMRVQRQSDKTLGKLFEKGMDDWEDADHKRYQLTQRYLTAAERKLERNRRMIWQYRREVRADAREKRAAGLFAGRQGEREKEAAAAPDEPRQKTDMAVVQTAVISVKEGQTVTVFSPSNENVVSFREDTVDHALVMRRLHFDCGEIPAEYAWCADQVKDGCFTVYHTLRTFLVAVEREAASGGHVQPWPELCAEDQHLIKEAVEKIWVPYE